MEDNKENSDGTAHDGVLNKVGIEAPKEVSAATVGRMMGLATLSDLKLLDSKIDLLATKVSGLLLKLEKALTLLANAPSGSDLERIDVQIGSLKTLIKEAMQEAQDKK